MYDSLLYIDVNRVAEERCKRPGGLAFFVKEFWDVIVPNELVWEPHMDVLCDEIQRADERVFRREKKEKDIIINVPPGTSKTLIVSVLSTCWEFAMCPWLRIFVGSYSDAAVMGIADMIGLVMKSEKYQRWFPKTQLRKDRSALYHFKTTENGEFYAFTVGGTLTGKHADILKVDDPLNPKQAASEAELKSAIHFFDKTLPTRKVDKEISLTYLIMQRLSAKDPTGHLLEKKKGEIHHICLPGEISKFVKPEKYKAIYQDGLLSPLRLSKKALSDLKVDLGSDGYAGQISQTPVAEGGNIWKKVWFNIVPDHLFPSPNRAISMGNDWDLAYTSEEDNAASAFIKSGIFDNKIYIFDFDFRWLEFPELIKWMKSIKDPHYIEAKASGKSAKQTLSKLGIVAIEVKLEGGGDKVARAKSASPTAESGIVYIKQSLADRFFDDEKQGILFFPKGQYKDVADTLAQMLQRRTKRGEIVAGNPNNTEGEDPDENSNYTAPIEQKENPLEWLD